jgi:cell division protein FtsZ
MLNISIQPSEVQKLSPKITVVGIGGAGGNAVNNMISSGLEGCEFLVCNTDSQALEGSLCDSRLQLGAQVTGGLGAGAKPEIGEKAAHESLDEVMQYLEGSNMAFITAGMGGGTGTGAAPVIAKACRDSGILTVGVVTKPFHFEGTHRMKQAEAGIEEMQGYVDTLIVIPNQNLFRVANEKTTFAEAFKMADSVLQSGVRGVTDLMVMPGLINLDFADIRSAMLEMGKAMMGTGEGEGDRRATEAAESAINNPLLDDVSMKGARGVIINVTGGADMTLFEVDEACNRIREEVDSNANIIFGSTFDEKLEGSMRVSVVATGIDAQQSSKTIGGGATGGGLNKGGVTNGLTNSLRTTPVTTNSLKESKSESASITAPAVTTASATISKPVVPQTEVARAMTLNARTEATTSASTNNMFEQQEFHAAQTQITGVTKPETSATEAKATTNKSTSEMRARVQNGNFIPPSPVVPEKQDDVSYMASPTTPRYVAPQQMNPAPAYHAPQAMASSVMAPTMPTAPVQQTAQSSVATSNIDPMAQGLVLRPPVPAVQSTVAPPERRRTPSLLERITGAYGNMMHGEDRDENQTDDKTETTSGESSGGFKSGLTAEKNTESPSQGQLNIDSPAAPAKEDDLDIPAFLRRQAN